MMMLKKVQSTGFLKVCCVLAILFVTTSQLHGQIGTGGGSIVPGGAGSSGGSVGNPCSGATLDIQQPSPPSILLSDNGADTVTPVILTVTPGNTAAGKCYLTFGFGQTGTNASSRALSRSPASGSTSTQTMAYTLTNPSGGVLADSATANTTNDVVVISFDGSNAPQTTQVSWTVKGNPQAALGTYTDIVAVQLFSGDAPSSLLPAQATSTLSLSAVVPSQIYASLAQPGQVINVFAPQPALVDFGDFSAKTNTEKTIDLAVLGTNGYNVSLVSDNKGKMRHADLKIKTPSPLEVPYSLQINQTSSGKTLEIPLADNTFSNPLSLDNYDGTYVSEILKLNFRLGDVPDNLWAGSYSDHIIITVTSAT